MQNETPTMQLTQDAFIFLAMAVFSFVLCFMAWQRRLVVAAFDMCLLMMYVGFWSFMLFCETVATDVSTKLLWSKSSYLFVTISPVQYLVFIKRYVGNQQFSTFSKTIFLFVVPVITVLLVWSNDRHHLMWTGLDPLPETNDLILYRRGVGFWIGVVLYSYLMLGFATGSLIRYLVIKRHLLRRKIWLLSGAAALPIITSILYLSGINNDLIIKLLPFMILISGTLFTVAFYYSGFYNTLPVARELLVEMLPDGILMLDHLNRVQDINKKAKVMLGISATKKMGVDINHVAPDRSGLKEAILSDAKTVVVKLDVEGSPVFHVTKESVKAMQGSRVIVIRDITEQATYQTKIKAEERKYRELYSLFRLLADNMPDMLWAKDLDMRFTFVNKSLSEEVLLVDNTNDPIGKTLNDFQMESCPHEETAATTPDFWSQSEWSDSMVMETRCPLVSDEYLCVGGEMKELDVRKSPIFDEQGNMVGIVGSARDVTHHRQIERELVNAKNKAQESDRLKSAFLANMSHEIRTPMNTILGFVSLLQETDLEESERADYLKIVKDSSERLLNTLSDIVDLSKIEAGYTIPNYSDFDVQELFMNLFTVHKKMADEKRLLFIRKWNMPESLIYIRSDKEKVYSIAANLINNAIKYTSQGFVEFRCNLTKERLEMAVKDTGIGIPNSMHQAVFDRFVQVDASHQRMYEGAGLGLSISKAYVEMLGGTIQVESELGKGSVFYVSLPISHVDFFLHDA